MDGEHGHGNSVDHGRSRPLPATVTIRKVPADSVPYGDSISHNGKAVWAAFDGESRVAVGATAGEARRKFWQVRKAAERKTAYGGRGRDAPYKER